MADKKEDKKPSTTKLELAHDYTVNGTSYKAGKDVEVNSDHVDAIKEMQESGRVQRDWETTHHGAVPQPADPQEATAQTPTRPLAAPNLVTSETLNPRVEQGDVIEVKDPGNVGADESNKGVAKPVDSIEANKDAK